jgi:hypothetical protein
MLHRGVALLGIFTLSPAHASLIEYSFTASPTNRGGDVREEFGVEIGGTLARGLFDDAVPRFYYAHYAGAQRLQTSGDSRQTGSHIGWLDYCLQEWVIGPLTNSQFTDAPGGYGALNRWSGMSFVNGLGMDAKLGGAIASTSTSVPEPTTLSLLGLGALGLLAARRRRTVTNA